MKLILIDFEEGISGKINLDLIDTTKSHGPLVTL